jgi:site-specific DNA-methyltransferase (adenine-specific)
MNVVRSKLIHFSSLTDDWKTPDSIYQKLHAEFEFNFDPCPFQSLIDGLSLEWGTKNFVNPPYSKLALWIKKAYIEFTKGKLVVMLIPSRTDTKAWHDYIMKAHEIRFIKGRLKFSGAKHNAPFPSCVVIFKPENMAKS